MKITKLLLGFSAIAVIALSTLGAKAHATTTSCTVDGTPLGKWGSTLTINQGQITSDFVVKGENCTITMSLVTWKAKSANAQPLYEQKINDFKTETFGPGNHSLTVNLPDCFYQADLMVGTKADWAEADNTPKRIELPADGHRIDGGLRDFKIGGDKVCVEPTPTPTPTPTQPPQVLPAATVTPAPTALTDTGMSLGAVAGIGLGIAAIGTMIHQFVLRKLYLS